MCIYRTYMLVTIIFQHDCNKNITVVSSLSYYIIYLLHTDILVLCATMQFFYNLDITVNSSFL